VTYCFDGCLGTVVNDDEIDFSDIQTFLADTCSDKTIVLVLLELFDYLRRSKSAKMNDSSGLRCYAQISAPPELVPCP